MQVKFENRHGLNLVGDLEMPVGESPRALALFAHCFTCTSKVRAAVHIARAMAAHGIAVLRFDFTGLGQSEGDFAASDFSANIDDLEDAAAWLAQAHGAPQLLVGHSLGGTAVLAAAARVPSCRALATINAPAQPEHVLRLMGDDLQRIEREGSAPVDLGGRPFRIRKDFVDDVRSHDMAERISALRRALLVLHSPVDTVVSVDNAQQIFVAARHPKSFVSLDNADHLLSRVEDSLYAGRVIAHWAGHYLEIPDDQHADAGEGVLVTGAAGEGFRCRVVSGRHSWIADEPEGVGGDLGPDPYAHLAAALGTCTVMTLNMYARHKSLPVRSVQVRVRHERIHADDCEDCETRSGKVDLLHREIAIDGDLSAEQRQRMLEIADRCPVHRTLESEIRVRSRLTD